MNFVYIEDRDLETGHGWRDIPHTLELESQDGRILVTVQDGGKWESLHSVYPEYSYAWITPKDYWNERGCIKDSHTTRLLVADFPDFQGKEDMEGHFSFHMAPDELRKYLENLRIRRVEKP